ncbi:UNKNOWN [Stylonychia lemnae]|uniref:Amino acid transporter transmembrane domain-containing protein n=1 Tax=Stylonychia lemnae TaxID=5949 RepID=A0A077ZS55_STYLE|nr:UNKNOWN [Stylonychia lemnae]|eukprot:CDW72205.1 UNKNOWN [Stylonychia lemnae]
MLSNSEEIEFKTRNPQMSFSIKNTAQIQELESQSQDLLGGYSNLDMLEEKVINRQKVMEGSILKIQNSEEIVQVQSTYIHQEIQPKQSSEIFSIFQFIAPQLGIGILTLPYVILENGLIFGSMLFIAVEVMNYQTCLYIQKEEIPIILIENFFGENVPSFLDSSKIGQIFWGTFSLNGAINSFPMIFFLLGNQPSIPMIYSEMRGKSIKKMKRIMIFGTILSTSLFLPVGIFGYLIFIDDETAIRRQNILLADFGNRKSIFLRSAPQEFYHKSKLLNKW